MYFEKLFLSMGEDLKRFPCWHKVTPPDELSALLQTVQIVVSIYKLLLLRFFTVVWYSFPVGAGGRDETMTENTSKQETIATRTKNFPSGLK